MPIVGLTKDTKLGTGLPTLGRLRLGGPKREREKGGKKYFIYGEELRWFRRDFSENPQATPEWDEVFDRIYGKQPEIIRGVWFFNDDIEDIFPNWYEDYRNRTIIRRCDGVTQQKHWEGAAGYSYEPIPCLMDAEKPCECQRKGRLMFYLPEFSAAIGLPGQFIMSMQGKVSIGNVNDALHKYQGDGAPLDKLSFVLQRTPGETTFPTKDGAPAASEHYFVELTVDSKFVLALNRLRESQMLNAGGENLASVGSALAVETRALKSGFHWEGNVTTKAELVDYDNPDEVMADFVEEGEVVPEYPPEFWALPAPDWNLTQSELERIYGVAKELGFKKKEDIFYGLGIEGEPLKAFKYPPEIAIDALETMSVAAQSELSPEEVAQIIGADLNRVQGYCFAHGVEARQILRAWMGVNDGAQ